MNVKLEAECVHDIGKGVQKLLIKNSSGYISYLVMPSVIHIAFEKNFGKRLRPSLRPDTFSSEYEEFLESKDEKSLGWGHLKKTTDGIRLIIRTQPIT